MLIIPVFIPFGGCEHKCVFCEQEEITGSKALPSLEGVVKTINDHLSTWKGKGRREVAFYGGSFTALPKELQREYLAAAYNFVKDGRIDALRVSTRPDKVTHEVVAELIRYKVETVELGVQSTSDEVLVKSGRGHTAKDSLDAVMFLKEKGLSVGVQLMPGLPGDTMKSSLETIERVVEVEPDFVRLYPTLVIKGTALYGMYKRGEYEPWGLEEMISLLMEALTRFEGAGIKVIKVGLHPSVELSESVVAGPVHPSLRQVVESRIMESKARGSASSAGDIV